MADLAWIELHQELREHRKIYACAELLKISRVTMVGTIVSLWLWALDNTPNGSLAGISNRTIARVCDFPEKKADALVNALTQTGWLDKSGNVLTIHDWNDYVGKLMDRRKKDRERKKKSTGTPQEFPRKSAQIPALQYSTITVPNRNNSARNTVESAPAAEESAPHSGKPFTSFWDAYPSKIDREAAREAWKDLNPDPQTAAAILSALECWKCSSQWTEDDGRFIPNAAKFLSKGYWRSPPKPSADGTLKPRRLDEDERAAIAKMMAQEDPT